MRQTTFVGTGNTPTRPLSGVGGILLNAASLQGRFRLHGKIEQTTQRIDTRTHNACGRGLRPAVIEKDYYVTEALRIISVTAGDKVIFKGGTSLSKGWTLIQRFSEDIGAP